MKTVIPIICCLWLAFGCIITTGCHSKTKYSVDLLHDWMSISGTPSALSLWIMHNSPLSKREAEALANYLVIRFIKCEDINFTPWGESNGYISCVETNIFAYTGELHWSGWSISVFTGDGEDVIQIELDHKGFVRKMTCVGESFKKYQTRYFAGLRDWNQSTARSIDAENEELPPALIAADVVRLLGPQVTDFSISRMDKREDGSWEVYLPRHGHAISHVVLSENLTFLHYSRW